MRLRSSANFFCKNSLQNLIANFFRTSLEITTLLQRYESCSLLHNQKNEISETTEAKLIATKDIRWGYK